MNLELRHQFDHLLNQSNPFSHESAVVQLRSKEMQDLLQHAHEFQQQSTNKKGKNPIQNNLIHSKRTRLTYKNTDKIVNLTGKINTLEHAKYKLR